MASEEIGKAAFIAALASNGSTLKNCYDEIKHYHYPHACEAKPSRPLEGHPSRGSIYRALRDSGHGASQVPDTQTVVCPFGDVKSLEAPAGAMGFDTTWIVQNTSLKSVVLARVLDGVETSPFDTKLSPMDDPKAQLLPGDWTSVPTFESFVYHVREIDDHGDLGEVVLQHRVGMIPLGNPHEFSCSLDEAVIDPEPFDPRTVGTEEYPEPQPQESGRDDLGQRRHCNTIDVGFRNEVGCPLTVSWAGTVQEIPDEGFGCGEFYRFHLGTNEAPQDFFHDWSSKTKYEGALMGQTFVARMANDPKVVVDKYTLEPTRIIDCSVKKKEATVVTSVGEEVRLGIQDQNGLNTDDGQVMDSLTEVQQRLTDSTGGSLSRAATSLSGDSG